MDVLTIVELWRELEARGFRLELKGESLHVRGQRQLLSPALRESITAHKAAIIEFLTPVPDGDTLPAVLVIPAYVPNTIEAISACVDAQRIQVRMEQAQ